MRIMALLIFVGIMMVGGLGLFYIRTVPHDPTVWHIDPRTVPPSETPNSFRVALPAITDEQIDLEAPIYEMSAAALAEAFDTFVMEQPRVERVAGTVDAGHITYVQRSEALGMPDYITVQFFDLGDTTTSTLALYTRSRFGYSDMGVNEARARSWLKSIESFAE